MRFHSNIALLPMAAIALASLTAGAGAVPARRSVPAGATAKVAPFPAGTQRPTRQTLLSIGEGELITLPMNVKDVWTSNPEVADVYVRSARQIYLFGKAFGEATVYATAADGTVVYSTNVRTSQNITSIDGMLKLAMPEANIKVTTLGQLAVLTGTVASPADAAEAEALTKAALNPGIDTTAPGAVVKVAVVSRLKTATPLQVNLQVKIAEVSRTFAKNIGNNMVTRDQTGGFTFGVASGRNPGSITTGELTGYPTATVPLPGGGSITGAYDPVSGKFLSPRGSALSEVVKGTDRTTLGFAGKLFGLDVLSALDLGERNGQVSTLANPNLSAMSGETGSFLAGGEIPIPISQGLGAVSVEYKQYGVSLTYTPTVLADGRISLRVRPEVSELSSAGAVTINGTQIPALTTRRAETTVELGSGQSMMIGGLLQNTHNNSLDKTPGAGDVPILGALFRSNAFQRNETELMIVITPYLVKPVDANSIVLPTDGMQAPTDAGRVLLGQLGGGQTGGDRPKPSVAIPATAAPTLGAQDVPLPQQVPTQEAKAAIKPSKPKKGSAIAAPGFSQ